MVGFRGFLAMPANLSPEYKAAEAAFRKAREPRERLEWLREMLHTIPKHKDTEHLQADIKARIKDFAEEFERPKRAGAHAVQRTSFIRKVPRRLHSSAHRMQASPC